MSASVSVPQTRPVAIPVAETLPWLIGAAVIGLLLYYFIGIDEGATSLLGNSMVVHEFVHDARHFLSFPCH
ncbi:MAG: CbtB-domain containing protein [Pseudonocardiales bacterium]|nr:CbtB-domain containing protein [Pseudonocardiales bacterium]